MSYRFRYRPQIRSSSLRQPSQYTRIASSTPIAIKPHGNQVGRKGQRRRAEVPSIWENAAKTAKKASTRIAQKNGCMYTTFIPLISHTYQRHTRRQP